MRMVLIFLALVPSLAAQTITTQPTETRLQKYVLSSGAVQFTGSSFRVGGTIGQPMIGLATWDSGRGSFGFWAAAGDPPPAGIRSVNAFPGDLKVAIYPSPFRAAANIAYRIAVPSHVLVTVRNTLGRPVRRMERLQEDTGTHLVAWDGSNDAGERLPPGAYFVTVRTYSAIAGGKGDASPAREQTERVLLLR